MTPPPDATRVSIIIPVYNGADYLRQAIDSALAQDHPDTEVVVVNDGSSDGGATDAIARSYGARICYVEKPNGGVASALNAGLAAMTGEVFCWLSHDDIHLRHKTSRQVAEWQRLGRPPALLFSDYRLIDGAGRPMGEARFDTRMLAEKPRYALLRGCVNGCTVFVPRDILRAMGGFDEALPTTQDYDLWHRMMGRVPFLHIPEILIQSRQHPTQGSRRADHREEARALWNRMATSVPVEEQARMEGSPFRFLDATSRFLAQNGLEEAAADLALAARQALGATLVSVLLRPGAWPERTHASLDSVAAQTHPTREVLLLAGREDARLAALHPTARWLKPGDDDAGWRAASGDWLALLDDGAVMLPTRLARQLHALEMAGAAVCHSIAWHHGGADHRLARATPDRRPGTMLLHRRALEADTAAHPHTATLEERLLRLADSPEALTLPEALTVLRTAPA
ncbi:glycosyltransferase [Roseococcus suduntuyensis]|uniref:Glycosyltransferase 2-like domain-containing protein n=1 Tax=Roseococcus suduntuyensis TaxID=455361 RepID=A0A840AI15_9PROT|nr:glycosyltransferase [Roseococcus suduntuyensis]MBB3900233.1 hypothetical protein [Roseococcus suduntuyensis]